jgi:hypothetical protein
MLRIGIGIGLGFASLLAVSSTAFAKEATHTHTWQIADGRLPKEQRLVKVQKGDTVQLTISSAQQGELHLHAYRLVLPVSKDVASKLSFKAHATGKFRFEWHGAADDKVKGGNHHAEPLATLEVRPN